MLGIPECDLAGAERERVMCTQSVTGLQSLLLLQDELGYGVHSSQNQKKVQRIKRKSRIVSSTVHAVTVVAP